MGGKHQKKAYQKPVLQKDAVVLKLGLAKQPVVLAPCGPDDKYVELKKMSPWLCEVVSGTPFNRAPLARSKLIEKFRDALAEGPDKMIVPGDKMAALKSGTIACRQLPTIAVDLKKMGSFEKVAQLPGKFGSSEKRSWKLYHKMGTECPWVHIEHIVDAIEYMNTEVTEHGVPQIEEQEDPNDTPPVCWDRRDMCWIVRVRGELSGVTNKSRVYVQKKNDVSGFHLTPGEFQTQKEVQRLAANILAEEMRRQ